MRNHKPRAVLFSAGGNDIAGYEMESFLNHSYSGLNPLREEYMAYTFRTVFRQGYEDFFKQVWSVDPNVHIIGHGYGRGIPDGRSVTFLGIRFRGPWLRPAFAKKGIENAATARSLMTRMMDAFNEMLVELAAKHPRFHYVDLRDLINDSDWVNELHVSNDTFGRIAQRCDAVIRSLP